MGWISDLFKKKKVQKLPEGKEIETSDTIDSNQEYEQVNNIKENTEQQLNKSKTIGQQKNDVSKNNNIVEPNTRIEFSMESSLSDYSEWYDHFHSQTDKYEGPISIYAMPDGKYLVTMKYDNNKMKDSVILGSVQMATKEDASAQAKNLTRQIDKLIYSMYGRNYAKYYDLKGYLKEGFDTIKSKFDISFTEEGEQILLNDQIKPIVMEKTVVLEQDKNGYILGYKQLRDTKSYNAFEIPNESNSYAGQTTITVPIEKCDPSKLTDKQKAIVISQLGELYETSAKLGILAGQEINNIQEYRNMLKELRKNKIYNKNRCKY